MNIFKLLKSLFGSAPRLAPLECSHRLRRGEAILIDVREPGEWNGGVAKDATLLSFSDLTGRRTQWQSFLAANRGREMLVYCASGGRSAIAARILNGEGFKAANTGGLSDWTAAGWPIEKPTRKQR